MANIEAEYFDGQELFNKLSFSPEEIDAVLSIYFNWTNVMRQCSEADCLETTDLFNVRVESALSRVDQVISFINTVIDPTYEHKDIELTFEQFQTIMLDLLVSLDCDLEFCPELAYDAENFADCLIILNHYNNGCSAQHKLRRIFQ